MAEEIDLSFLAKLAEQNLVEMRQLRKEVADVRTLALQNVEYTRRLDRRMGELRDDLEISFKAELLGALGHFEGRIEIAIAALSERVAAVEQRLNQ